MKTRPSERYRSWLIGELLLVCVLAIGTILLFLTGRLDGYALPNARVALDTSVALMAAPEDPRAKIQHLLVTGDNRLKQGVSLDKVRASYEAALDAAREAGLDAAARLPRPNLAARSAAEAHDVRRQAERVEELLARAAASPPDRRA